jgi:hypothetical protein
VIYFKIIVLPGEIYPKNAYKQFVIVLTNSPTCFGFQVPSSGGYSFLIYKLLQVVSVSGRCGQMATPEEQ